ncbi:MAG: AzlC family ABC transporter permease, partial [Rhodospirillaceae bacterium]|nr:AzlC family ABC transporter permease [Rhodospirillaceae bacterium]
MTTKTQTDRTIGSEIGRGLLATLPVMISAFPFGLIFGALGIAKGLSPLAVMCMSLFVFSGSAQFIAILLLGTGSGLGVIWLATLILNLRHLLYAATLVDHVRHLNQIWRFTLSAWLTDETFAVMERRYRVEGDAPHAHWYYLTSC